MSWHRKIDIRIHGDEKYRRLSKPQPNGRTLFEHLLYGPHTDSMPGLSVAGARGMAEALGWELEGFREAFGEVYGEGLAQADWEARVVYVKNAIRYNPPASPNVIRGWAKRYDLIPECALKREWLLRVKSFLENEFKPERGSAAAFLKAFMEVFGEAFAEGSEIVPRIPIPHSPYPRGGTRARARATPPPAAPSSPPPSRADAPPGARKRKAAAKPEHPAAPPPRPPEKPDRAERVPKPASRAQLTMLEELAAERGIDPADLRPRTTPEGRVLLWPPIAATVTHWRQWLERQPRVQAVDHDADDGPPTPTAAAIEALWRRTPEMRPAVLAAELDAAPSPVRRAILARLEEQLEAEAGEAGTSLLDLVVEARGMPPDVPPEPFPVFGPADIPGVHRLLQQRRQGVSQDAFA